MKKNILNVIIAISFSVQLNAQNVIYNLLQDADGDVTLSTYNSTSNTLTNSFDLNNTSLANGFYESASVYDIQNEKIIVVNESGQISHIDVLTGSVTDYNPPFAFSGGFNWALFYDNELQKIYSLLQDADGDVTLSTYNSTSNTLTNSFDLNSTSLANGFYESTSVYDIQNKKIIIFNESGQISHIDVLTGSVTDYNPPFTYSGGFNWILFSKNSILTDLYTINSYDTSIALFLQKNDINIISASQNIYQIWLLNISGQLIYFDKVNSKQHIINISNYPKGIYVIKIEQGIQINEYKFLIK